MTDSTQAVRVTARNIIAQATNYTLGSIDAIARELVGNAASYCSPGEHPTCYLTLLNPNKAKLACFISRTVSTFSDEDAEHMLDIGHVFDKEMRYGQCFNLGLYAVAAMLCLPNKLGLIAISYDPSKGFGRVVRARCSPEGHMMKVGPFRFDLTEDGKNVTFVKTPAQEKDINAIKQIWFETQWQAPRMNEGLSDETFGAFCFDVCASPAIEARKAMSTFVYTDLKSVTCDDCGDAKCILEAYTRPNSSAGPIHDIRLYADDSQPSLRSCVKNAFCPAIANFVGMAAAGADPKKREVFVQGQKVNVNLDVDPYTPRPADLGPPPDPVGWLQHAAWLLNRPAACNRPLMLLMDGRVWFRCCHTKAAPDSKAVKENWESTSKMVVTANERALPSGIIALHGDKKINRKPFDVLTGDGVYTHTPRNASLYSTLVNKLFGESRFDRDDVDTLFTLLDMPEAKRERDVNLEQHLRVEAREETRRVIGKSYVEMHEIIVKPVRRKLRVCNVETLEMSEGKHAREVVCFEDQHRVRSVLTELLGLNTTAILQLQGMEQPVNKETVSHISVASEEGRPTQCCARLHCQIVRAIVRFNTTTPSPALKKHMDDAHAAWAKLRADELQEEKNVEEIKKRRKQRDEAIAAAERGREKEREKERARLAAVEAARSAGEASNAALMESEKRARDAEARAAKADRASLTYMLRSQHYEQRQEKTKERGAKEKEARSSRECELHADMPSRVVELQSLSNVPDDQRYNRAVDLPYSWAFEYAGKVKSSKILHDLFRCFEAYSVLFRPDSLLKDTRPVFHDWVTSEMRTEALCNLFHAVPQALQCKKMTAAAAPAAPAAAAAARVAVPPARGPRSMLSPRVDPYRLAQRRQPVATVTAPAASSAGAGCSYQEQVTEEDDDDGIEEEVRTEGGSDDERGPDDDDSDQVTQPPAKRARTSPACVDIDA